MNTFCREHTIPHIYAAEHERRLRQQRERQAAAQRHRMACVGTVVVLTELSRRLFQEENYRVAETRRTTMGTNQSSVSLHEERSSECRMSLKGSARCLDGSISQIYNKTCWYREIIGIDVLCIRFMFDIAAQFYDTYLAAVVEWGLGAAKAAADKLEKIKDAVMEALNWFIQEIIEIIATAFETAIKAIQTLFDPMIQSFANFLYVSAHLIEESEQEESAALGDVTEGIDIDLLFPTTVADLLYNIITITLLEFTAMTIFAAVVIIAKIKSGGLTSTEAVCEPLFKRIKNILLFSLLGMLAKNIYTEGQDTFKDEETSVGDSLDSALDLAGLSFSFSSMVVSAIEAFAEKAKATPEVSNLKFYFGLTLTFFGFFLDAATTCRDLKGVSLQIADVMGMAFALAGLGLMVKYRDKGEHKVKNRLTKLVSIIEWVLGIGGAVATIWATINDFDSNWE